MTTLGAVVIGLGKIGLQSDMVSNSETNIFTHSRAFYEHQGFTLLGGMDPNPDRCQEMMRLYACKAFTSIESLLETTSPDIIALAGPTATHADSLHKALAHSTPRAILCEKPLAGDIGVARSMVEVCRNIGCHLFVNYIRRADFAVQEIYRRIQNGEIVTPLKGVVWYSKGLLHNGSHLFDLLTFWLGKFQGSDVINKGSSWQGDPEPDLFLKFDGGDVFFLAAKEEDYSHYTVELVSPSGRVRYDLGGWHVVWQPAQPSSINPGYVVLDRKETQLPNQLSRIQWHVVDQLANAVSGKTSRLCTGDEALSALEHLIRIRDSL